MRHLEILLLGFYIQDLKTQLVSRSYRGKDRGFCGY